MIPRWSKSAVFPVRTALAPEAPQPNRGHLLTPGSKAHRRDEGITNFIKLPGPGAGQFDPD